jgi:hypothetical protein
LPVDLFEDCTQFKLVQTSVFQKGFQRTQTLLLVEIGTSKKVPKKIRGGSKGVKVEGRPHNEIQYCQIHKRVPRSRSCTYLIFKIRDITRAPQLSIEVCTSANNEAAYGGAAIGSLLKSEAFTEKSLKQFVCVGERLGIDVN